MDVATWNVLHDGRLTAANGSVPGDLTLTVEIAYLRRHLPSRSRDLSLALLGCERFEYLPYEAPALTEPSAIAALGLELLRAESSDDGLSVECADGSYGGKLLVRYENAVFITAEGRTLSQSDLEAASERYWMLWEQ
jgi:hypothetical protein